MCRHGERTRRVQGQLSGDQRSEHARSGTARALAGFTGKSLALNGLTRLDGGVALATRPGSLVIPNREKISPKTLLALIEKEDVVVPLIEKLEMIQEPDGSVTEDLVIPEWLQERQKRQVR
jgi:hypothetical protein